MSARIHEGQLSSSQTTNDDSIPDGPMDKAAARKFFGNRFSAAQFKMLADTSTRTITPDQVRGLVKSFRLEEEKEALAWEFVENVAVRQRYLSVSYENGLPDRNAFTHVRNFEIRHDLPTTQVTLPRPNELTGKWVLVYQNEAKNTCNAVAEPALSEKGTNSTSSGVTTNEQADVATVMAELLNDIELLEIFQSAGLAFDTLGSTNLLGGVARTKPSIGRVDAFHKECMSSQSMHSIDFSISGGNPAKHLLLRRKLNLGWNKGAAFIPCPQALVNNCEDCCQLGIATMLEYDAFKATPDYADLKAREIATKAEYDDFKASPDYADLKALEIKTKAEYDTFKASPDYADLKGLEITTKAEYDTFKASPDYADLKELEILTKADYDTFKASPEYADLKSLQIGIEKVEVLEVLMDLLSDVEMRVTPAPASADTSEVVGRRGRCCAWIKKSDILISPVLESALTPADTFRVRAFRKGQYMRQISYENFRASGDYDDLKALGILTKPEYEVFKVNPAYDDLKKLEIQTKTQYDTFKGSSDYADLKRLGITTKAEYDGFKMGPGYADLAELEIATKPEYDAFKASPDYADLKTLEIVTKAEYDAFKASPDYEDLKTLEIVTKAEYDTFKASDFYADLKALGIVTKQEYEAFRFEKFPGALYNYRNKLEAQLFYVRVQPLGEHHHSACKAIEKELRSQWSKWNGNSYLPNAGDFIWVQEYRKCYAARLIGRPAKRHLSKQREKREQFFKQMFAKERTISIPSPDGALSRTAKLKEMSWLTVTAKALKEIVLDEYGSAIVAHNPSTLMECRDLLNRSTAIRRTDAHSTLASKNSVELRGVLEEMRVLEPKYLLSCSKKEVRDECLIISHKWRSKGLPNFGSVQSSACGLCGSERCPSCGSGQVDDKLRHIQVKVGELNAKRIWLDWCCLPQQSRYKREAKEEQYFKSALKGINMLYLTGRVVILLDEAYKKSFWCNFEAFCATHKPTKKGLEPKTATELKDNLFIIPLAPCSHYHANELREKWLCKSVEEAVKELKTGGYTVTNGSDIEICCTTLEELHQKAKDLISQLEALEQIPCVKEQGGVPFQVRTGIEASEDGHCQKVILPSLNAGNSNFNHLPDLGSLHFLTHLNLENCGLLKMDTIASLPKCIEEINLKGNKIEGQIRGFENLSNIQVVKLNNNRLDGCFPWTAMAELGSLDHRASMNLLFYLQGNEELTLPTNVKDVESLNNSIIQAFGFLERAMSKRSEELKKRLITPSRNGIRFKCLGVCGSTEEGLNMELDLSDTMKITMDEWFGKDFVEKQLYRFFALHGASKRFYGQRFDFDPLVSWKRLGMKDGDMIEFILNLKGLDH